MKLSGLILVAALAAPVFAYGGSPPQCTRDWDEAKRGRTTGADSYKSFMMACLQNRPSATTPQVAMAFTVTAPIRPGHVLNTEAFKLYYANPRSTIAPNYLDVTIQFSIDTACL
jgi:hypothetical protein